MTRKEFKELEDAAYDIIAKIKSEFRKRIQELYVIAQEKGYGTEFGWVEGEVAYPDEDDFETEEEYEKAEEEYCAFNESSIRFVWEDDHNFIPYDGYSFVIDENGDVIFTSVINRSNEEDEEFEDNVRARFYPHIANNWGSCSEIIGVIEYELGL